MVFAGVLGFNPEASTPLVMRKIGVDPDDKCKSEALFLTQKSNSLLISIVISDECKIKRVEVFIIFFETASIE